jgi:hypothetical protein
MRSTKVKGRTFQHGPHTSVILPALGSLPSVALSSGRINIKYLIKNISQRVFDNIDILGGKKTGILIVVGGN